MIIETLGSHDKMADNSVFVLFSLSSHTPLNVMLLTADEWEFFPIRQPNNSPADTS